MPLVVIPKMTLMIPATLVRQVNLYSACISILMLLLCTGTHDTYGSPQNTSGYGTSSTTHGPSTGAGDYGANVTGAGGLNSAPGYEAATNHGSTTGAGGYGPGTGTSGLKSGPGYGKHGSTTGPGVYGPGAETSNTYGSSNTGHHGSSNRTAGPHESNLVNKVDPRVDSDRGECMLCFQRNLGLHANICNSRPPRSPQKRKLPIPQ